MENKGSQLAKKLSGAFEVDAEPIKKLETQEKLMLSRSSGFPTTGMPVKYVRYNKILEGSYQNLRHDDRFYENKYVLGDN